MKIVFVAMLQFSHTGTAQTVYIPDIVFANWLYNHGFSTCMTGVQLLDTTCAALLSATAINCSGYNIQDLTGIQYFKSLRDLSAWGCSLAVVPALPNTLRNIDFYDNQLASLPRLPDSLRSINANLNNLTILPEIPPLCTLLAVNNNQLTSLPTLPSSMTIIWVSDNPALACLPPIINFAGTTTGNSIMVNNTSITCFPNWIPHSGFWYPIDTFPICNLFNPAGCSTIWNIEGRTFHDADSSCTTTTDGPIVENIKVLLFDNAANLLQQTYTRSEGFYSFDTGLGDFHTQVDTTDLPFHVLCPGSNDYASNLTVVDSTDAGLDFRLVCKPGFDLCARSMQAMWFGPGREVMVRFQVGDLAAFYGSHCTNHTGGTVTVTFSGPITYLGPDSGALIPSLAGSTLTYNIADFDNVDPLRDFRIIVETDTNATMGMQACFTVNVSPATGDANPANNVLTHCFQVFASFDPNDKQVSPVGPLNPAVNPVLTYTIRFQNTGTAPAEHIYIIDTLDADLDWSTFQLLSWSHEPLTQVTNGIARFSFPNINLPDSVSDEPGSHGYVQYKIQAKGNLSVGTQILNTAHIFFDFNPAVITNTTLNTISSSVGIGLLPGNEFQANIYPNPSRNAFTLSIRNKNAGTRVTVKVYDAIGSEIFNRSTMDADCVIPATEWRAGIYFARIEMEGSYVIKKLVKD